MLSTISCEDFKNELKPDIIISIGGQTGDYPLYGILSKQDMDDIEHWRVSTSGDVVDTYDKLTKIFECSEKYFFSRFTILEQVEHTYHRLILQHMRFDRDVDIPFSNAYAARALTQIIPANSNVQFSILNSLRVWNLFEFKNTVRCFSNVGAFGIDGGMSTLIGQSMVSEDLCFMVIGDLAFLYDMNSLGIRGLKNNLRILLINNNGGVEFKLGMLGNESIDRFIAAGNHFKNAKGWAETCGFRYISACSSKEFDDLKNDFVTGSDVPILFELFVSDIDDALAYSKLIKLNKDNTAVEALKDGLKLSVKRILGRIV
jgi:2-succinyl-5-enolpyruvyl-6-hydroxy-3-cyclohexene-1-carboxylate synthase